MFVKQAAGGQRLVVPGVIIPNGQRPKRKFPEYAVRFGRAAIEAFVVPIEGELSRIEEATINELHVLTHDLRALSADIYSAADLVKTDLANRHHESAAYRIENVIAAHQVLSIRLDIVDFTTRQFALQEPERIGVYRKVDKVRKFIKPRAQARGIELEITGPSVACTFGPPIFELVPFVIIQNAVKYAPKGSKISIKVTDLSDRIDVHVRSLGPKIREGERLKIFERGYRGVEARETGASGSGLGLYAAKVLTEEEYLGSIGVIQDGMAQEAEGAKYWQTKFTVSFPRRDA